MARKPSTMTVPKPDAAKEPEVVTTLENGVTETDDQNGTAVLADDQSNTENNASPDEAPVDWDRLAKEAGTEVKHVAASNGKPEIPEADFTDFDAAVEAILAPVRAAEASGESTSGVPDENLIPPLVTAYQALEGAKNKRAGRERIKAISEQSMAEDKFYTAKAAMLLDDKLVSAKSTKTARVAKVPTDPTQDFIDHLVTLNLAFQYAGYHQPDGLADDWQDQYNAKIAPLTDEVQALGSDGDESEVNKDSLLGKAIKLGTQRKAKSSSGRVSNTPRVGGYSGPPRSIVKHIIETFENADSGTFLKIGDIAKFESQEYGSDHPSPGAISGQYKNKKFSENFPGLEAVEIAGIKGIRKL